MAYLVILDGDRSGEEIQLTSSEISLGRSDDNVISLDGPAISGHHCLIRNLGNMLLAIDLDSTNGTRVNKTPITEHELRRGDILTLGTTAVRIEGEELEPGDNLVTKTTPSTESESPIEESAPVEISSEEEVAEIDEEEVAEIDAEQTAATHRANIQPRTRKDMAPVSQMKDFGKKRDNRKAWIVVIGIVSVVILGLLSWVIKSFVQF